MGSEALEYGESGFVRLPDASIVKRRRCLDNNMALSDAEALKMDRSAATDVLCGCAFCIPATAQTDGFDRCPRFLRRHEVRYMEAYFVMG